MTPTFAGSPVAFARAVLALTIGWWGPPSAALAAPPVDAPTYLALGDSVPFGLDPHLVPEPRFSCYSCSSFTATAPPRSGDVFVGYPEYLQARLGIALVNASCPGETSASFGGRVAAVGQAAICAEFKEQDWLHVGYGGTQRRYALDYLARHPRVALVTLTLGANDVLDLVAACGGDSSCVGAGLGGVLTAVYGNVSAALGAIRSAGYGGPVVVPTYYAPSPEWTELVSAVNAYVVLAAAGAGAVPVDLQALFGRDPCGAGLLIPIDPLDRAAGCDMHPSEAGARLIANAIATALGR